MKRIYLFTLLIFITSLIWGGSFSRTWTYHLSNVRTSDVVKGGDKIYFLSEGGIYYYNQLDNSTTAITKIDGLSGSDFSGMEYSDATKSLVVYYENSMIDIITEDDEILQIFDIKRKNISGNKLIYNATCKEGFCYFSCGFGIVVLDLIKLEIKDSFIVGDNGSYQVIYDIALDDDNIYAGTSEGIKYAPLEGVNLLDYTSWQYIENKFVGTTSYNMLTNGFNRVWAIHTSVVWHGDRSISKHGPDLWYPEYSEIPVIYDLNFNSDKVVYCGRNANHENGVYIFQNQTGLIQSIKDYPFKLDSLDINPRSAVIDDDGTIWIADLNYGGIRLKNGEFETIQPDGPINNKVFSMSYSNNKLWVAAGGRGTSWGNIYEPALVQSFSQNQWEYFNNLTHPELKNYFDVVNILPSPSDPNHIFVGTWGGGILEFKNGKLINNFNDTNSSLQNAAPSSYFVRIGGMQFDSNGNLWVSNSSVENNLHMKKPDDTWKAFNLPEIAINFDTEKIIVTENDDIWMIVPRGKTNGLYIMSNDGKQKEHLSVIRYFTNGTEEGTDILQMNNVLDIVEDNNGEIWLGTTYGIAVYSNPERIFEEDPYYASQPGIDENDGIYHPLLLNKTVTSIAVDGGNRKWCGTSNSGLYLISADGTEELEHFTIENSGLISDAITCLEYDGDNGVLYVGTQLGIVSFITESKKSYDHFTDVYAYPNPVNRSKYTGSIYINGMMENTNVKITSISGRLVYETTSIGGKAVWNGIDLAGNTVSTGVYLVLCASENGEESVATKILFIR